MLRWEEFKTVQPELAEAGRSLLYQFGVGLAFLATVRRDGGPRVHPVSPLISEDRLCVFVGKDSRKLSDLRRDPRFALHSFPTPSNDDEFYITGAANEITTAELCKKVYTTFVEERATTSFPSQPQDPLFELLVDKMLHTKTREHGDWEPVRTVWRAT